MTITAGQNAVASDFITNAERNATKSNDSGRVPQLEADGYLHGSWTKGQTIAFTASEDLTIGTPVGIANLLSTSKVAKAYRRNATVALGLTVSSNTYLGVNSWCTIGGDKFVFLVDQTSDDSLYAVVASVSTATNTITLGTPVAVTADIYGAGVGARAVISKLGTDKFIVFYREDASTTVIKSRVGTVSGTTITYGSASTFATGADAVVSFASDYISTDKGIMFYGGTTATNSRLICFTVSGTTVTAGTPKAIGTTIDNGVSYPTLRTVGTDKFILITESLYYQIGTVVGGTTITLGSEALTPFTSIARYGDSAYLDTGKYIFSNTDGTTRTFAIATISGTVATFGTLFTGDTASSGICADTTSSFIYGTGSTFIRRCTVSGTTISATGVGTITMRQSYTTHSDSNGQFIKLESSGVFVDAILTEAQTVLTYGIQGMSNNYIGFAQSTVSAGQSVNVLVSGIDANQTGLIAGQPYLVTGGALTFAGTETTINTIDDTYLVKALSATEVLV